MFIVFDIVDECKGTTIRSGLYYVETDNYMPLGPAPGCSGAGGLRWACGGHSAARRGGGGKERRAGGPDGAPSGGRGGRSR